MTRTNINRVTLKGTFSNIEKVTEVDYPLYKMTMEVPRLSGTIDAIPCQAPESVYNKIMEAPDAYYKIEGNLKTRNNNGHVFVFIWIKNVSVITESSGDTNNIVEFEGYICKSPNKRQLNSGIDITDTIIAINNEEASYYCPCILWGRDAREFAELEVGTKVKMMGRIQSRDYTKEEKTYTTYELSVRKYEILKKKKEVEKANAD